jgi:DNA-binding transcriptional MerR regulator
MLASLRVARRLRRQRMPIEEIRAVLTTEDPLVVRRYVELHTERLDEWVAEQRQFLAILEHSVAHGSND